MISFSNCCYLFSVVWYFIHGSWPNKTKPNRKRIQRPNKRAGTLHYDMDRKPKVKPVEKDAYSSHHVYDARHTETRVKEMTNHLPSAEEGKLDGTLPSSRAIPMKNNSPWNHLHGWSSRTPDLRFQKDESRAINPITDNLLTWESGHL